MASAAGNDTIQRGTTVQRNLFFPNPKGEENWYNTDLGCLEWYNPASSQWEKDLTPVNGAMPVSDGALAAKITSSGGYTYVGEAAPGTAQATAAWRCCRIDSTGTTVWADGDGNFDNVATDLTALSYG